MCYILSTKYQNQSRLTEQIKHNQFCVLILKNYDLFTDLKGYHLSKLTITHIINWLKKIIFQIFFF